MKTILLLEDNAERTLEFERAVKLLGPEYSLKIWPDAQAMVTECEEFLEQAALISLDHDLNPTPKESPEPLPWRWQVRQLGN